MKFIIRISLICIGVVGLACVGYAFSFDYRRRHALNYKAMIRFSKQILIHKIF